MTPHFWRVPIVGLVLLTGSLAAQEKSVRPDINKPFENPDLKGFLGKFEVESREIYSKRQEIVKACKLKPGVAVADIGAGTGLFTRLFAKEVGAEGKVYAVDVAKTFLDHIDKTCKDQGIKNVSLVQCTQKSCELPANSIDVAFVCDTYHHFEFPFRTLDTLHRALKPGGQLIVIDFKRIPGVSSEWILGHVRAGQEVFTKEIVESGFKQVEEVPLLKENYVLRFEKRVRPAPGKSVGVPLIGFGVAGVWCPSERCLIGTTLVVVTSRPINNMRH
jgi:ubiquinone/menaquinone biosynthesis C-methylase UbiE